MAALLLVAVGHLRRLALPHPTATAVLEALGATKTRAYALAEALSAFLPTLGRPPGRPTKPEPATDEGGRFARLGAIATNALRYLYEHPGAVCRHGHRLVSSPEFKRWVVETCARNRDLGVESIAHTMDIPASTLREWMRESEASVAASEPTTSNAKPSNAKPSNALAVAVETSSDLEVQTILDQHRTWAGSFSAFCEHLHRHHGIGLRRTAIASVLERAGVRQPMKRLGRTSNEKAMRDAFQRFFPGAQWTADGTTLTAEVGGRRFRFDLELCVDTCCGAFVGLDVRDHECAEAVIAAFDEGVCATGNPPLAVLLDNKACNLCPEVDEAIGDTLCIPATPARPQNKGHVEGAFGLFSQQAPPLRLNSTTDEGRARELVELCGRIFFGALNMRPRKSKAGLSRIDLYAAADPTPAQVEQAKAALQARLDHQREARRTLRERQCPHKRATLADAFTRFGLDDPSGNVLDACARHPLHAIVDGIAVFDGKRGNDSLPDDLREPARYLLGIINNLAQQREGMAIARALWDERICARDRLFRSSAAQLDVLVAESHDPAELLRRLVGRALHTERAFEQHFWLTSIVDQIVSNPVDRHRELFLQVARDVHSTFAVSHALRQDAVHFIADAVLPVS